MGLTQAMKLTGNSILKAQETLERLPTAQEMDALLAGQAGNLTAAHTEAVQQIRQTVQELLETSRENLRCMQKAMQETRAASRRESEKLLKEFQSQAGKINETYFSRLCRAEDMLRESANSIRWKMYIPTIILVLWELVRHLWLREIAPGKLAKSTIRRDQQDIVRILPTLGHYKLTELRSEHFRAFYGELRKTVSTETKKPLSEYTVEGVHATLCGILSDAVEGGFLRHNPAWRTYRYAGRKTEKKIADAETVGKIIPALEDESIKYETYFKLVIATGMRRGECCALQWATLTGNNAPSTSAGTR